MPLIRPINCSCGSSGSQVPICMETPDAPLLAISIHDPPGGVGSDKLDLTRSDARPSWFRTSPWPRHPPRDRPRSELPCAVPSPCAWASCCEAGTQIVAASVRSYHGDLPALMVKKHADAMMARTEAHLADLADAGFRTGPLATAGSVVAGRRIHLQNRASLRIDTPRSPCPS